MMAVRGGITGLIDVGMGVQTHEVVTLVLLVVGAIPVILAARRFGARWFFVGYAALVGGGIATVVETMAYGAVLNIVEHLFTLSAALFFLFSAYWSHGKVAGHPRDWRDVL